MPSNGMTRWLAAIVVAATLFAAPALALASTAPGASRGHHPYIGTRPTIPAVGSLAPSAVTIETTSGNWAGYAVQTQFPTGQTNSVSDVKATWVVPAVLGGMNDAYAANWVGIDGYSSNTVEQIGTEQDWTRGSGASYSAWYEMYPNASIAITTMNIRPGDVVTAEVTWMSGTTYRLYLSDASNGQSFSIVQAISGALRNSAEWIVEAPSDNAGVLPFTNQAVTTFSACSVTVDGASGPIGGSLWRNDPMTFVGGSGAVLAVPSALNPAGDGFSVGSPTVGDTTPPTTTSDALASYDNVATIHLSAVDNAGGTGVAATYYQLDGLLTQSGTAVTVSNYGPHTLAFWSVDRAGTAEAHNSVSFTVNDTIPPVTTSDAQLAYPSAATIRLSATDNAGGSGVASIDYALDGAQKAVGNLVTTSVTGTHTLEFWSVDNAGNVEPSHFVTFVVGEYQVLYAAGAGGTISGVANQTVAPGSSGTAVTAVASPGFHFVNWSDGVLTATRVDSSVRGNIAVTASFAANPRKATSISLSVSASSLRLGRSLTLSSRLTGAKSGTAIRYEVQRPGSSSWILLANRTVTSTGASSVTYRPTKRGSYRFRVRFLGTTSLTPSTSSSRLVRFL